MPQRGTPFAFAWEKADPREFNGSDDPSFDLTTFAAEHAVNDVIVYPFKINEPSYITRLNRLVGVN